MIEGLRSLEDIEKEVIAATLEATRYKISQATGISQANLSRFVHGTRGLSMESLDALCGFLGLSLVQAKHKGSKNG